MSRLFRGPASRASTAAGATVEKVIQQASNDAAASEDAQDLTYILPHIDTAIERFTDNVCDR